MPTENKAVPFAREDRYIVLKLKRLPKDEAEYLRDCHPKAMVECVVVESDWPEYQLVWAMIEHRMAGKPVPDFSLWRRADALQALLTAADERADVLERDKARIDWLAEQPVDTLYLDDGRIIDIAGRVDLRDAIDAAMAAPAPADDDCQQDDSDSSEPPCSACFARGCNGECMENL